MRNWSTILIMLGGGLLVISVANYAVARSRDLVTVPVGPIKVVAIGDSLTAGKAYCRALKALVPPGSVVKCIGKENAGVKKVRELAAQGHLPGANFVIVLAGVNDLASDRSVSTVTSGLARIYEMAHSVGASVIAVTLTPWLGHRKGGKLGRETHDVNTWIRNQSSADIVVESSTLGKAGYLMPSYNAGDGLHLSQEGQQALADTIMYQSFGIIGEANEIRSNSLRT